MKQLAVSLVVISVLSMAVTTAGCGRGTDENGTRKRPPRMNIVLTPQDTLSSFRFERHMVNGDDTGSEVYVARLTPHGTYLYFRLWNSSTGWSYDGLDLEPLLVRLTDVLRMAHVEQYKYKALKYEKTDSNRWMLQAKTVAERSISLVSYTADDSTRQRVVDVFDEFLWRIAAGELRGAHTRFDYSDGQLKREVNFDAHGNVLNGHDYDDPDSEF